MAIQTVKIAPMNRIEGHLDIECQLDGSGNVTYAETQCVMFRGFENILIGRDPRDATILCQRI